MAAPGVFDNFQRIRSRSGGSGVPDIFPASQRIAASQNVKKNDILSLDGSGYLTQSIALPGTNSTGTASGGNLPIAGIATCDFVTDSNGVFTTPNQAGWTGSNAGITGNIGSPPVLKLTDIEILFRIYDGTATSTQQDDVIIGTAYQFQRWRDTSSSVWWYSLIITTTNGEFEVVERAPMNPGSGLTDNYGLVWCRPILSATVRQL